MTIFILTKKENVYLINKYGNSCTIEKNCYSGDKTLGLCKQCVTGYYLDFKDGKCKSNEEEDDFKYCRVAEGVCTSCLYRTYLGFDNKCSLSKNCLESEKGKCIQCVDGYHLDLENKCTNIDKCINVDYNDYIDKCLECEDKYYYNQTSKECEEEKEFFENCKITALRDNICAKCKKDYYLNATDNLCYSNKDKNNFYKCDLTDDNGEFCISCIEGFYL